MPAMKYCMFEVTEDELNQVVDEMSNIDSWKDKDFSEREVFHRNKLYELCRLYINEYNRLNNEQQLEIKYGILCNS